MRCLELAFREVHHIEHIGRETEAVAKLLDEDAGVNLPYLRGLRPGEIDECEAGVPCVMYSDHADAIVYESGDKVTKRTPGLNGLTGQFLTTATAPQNGLIIENGAWVIQNSSDRNERAKLRHYSAYIKSIDNIEVLDEWAGMTMPVRYLVTSVSGISSDKENAVEYYTIDGKKLNAAPASGTYIRVSGGKSEKIIR